MNFYISFQISEDAVGVNLAGRQRMLSQRMTKSLLQIQNANDQNQSNALNASIEELRLTRKLFDETLNGFAQGGNVTGAAGDSVLLKPVTSTIAKQNVTEAGNLWAPYIKKIDDFLNVVTQTQAAKSNVDQPMLLTAQSEQKLADVSEYAGTHNLTLLKLMNNLTVELENIADSKAKRLRVIQTVGILLALVNFFIIMFHFLRQLRESDAKIEEARQETTEILENVGTGLFLLDSDLRMGNQYSKELEDIMGQKNLGNKFFHEILEGYISEKDLRTTKKFIKQLYNPRVDEMLIEDLNPLKQIKVVIDSEKRDKGERYLDYRFSRVYEEGEISRILVNVADVTNAVRLEEKLAKEREQNSLEIEMLTTILNTDINLINDFLRTTGNRIGIINNTLKQPGSQEYVLREKLVMLYREMHTIKGESSALGLHSITSVANDFELSIKALQNKNNLTGDDFLSLTVLLDKLIDSRQNVADFSARISEISQSSQTSTVSSATKEHFEKFAQTLAKRHEKQVNLICEGFDTGILSNNQKSIVREIGTQLLRNAMVHGLETPDIRTQLGKSPEGQIKLLLVKNISGTQLVVEDDGNGIDYDAIRKKAAMMPQYTAKEVSLWDKRQLLQVLFSSGFSTLDDANEDAGRGVGLDVIANHVKALKGSIKIDTQAGKFTRFTITFSENAG